LMKLLIVISFMEK